MGAYLLDQAGYRGPRVIWTVSPDEPPAGCAKLGAELAAAGPRTALLVLGDGSARRGPKAPGAFDPRAAAFDAEVERAVRAADLDALLAVDPALARDLMATGRPAWQVLAGALAAGAGQPGAGQPSAASPAPRRRPVRRRPVRRAVSGGQLPLRYIESLCQCHPVFLHGAAGSGETGQGQGRHV